MDLAVMNESAENQLELLELASFADKVKSQKIEFGELTIEVDAADIYAIIEDLRRNKLWAYTTLVDVTAIDYPAREKRFVVVYHLLSMMLNQRIRIHVPVGDGEVVPSITPIHPAANWFEREVFDMFGISFSGHPDLRRILTDYGFEGHPLRKDFPMTGFVQMRYDEVEKRCVYEPVDLVQDFRSFDFLSPWEGANYALPGDEKAEKGEL